MNIFYRELKANFKSLLIWIGFIIFFIYMGISKYAAFTMAGSEVMEMMDSLPEAVLSAFQINALNLTTLSGYYGVMFTYFALMASIFAVLLGNGIIAKEERDKTVEFSLTLPIPRHKLITGKIAAALVNCLIFALAMWGFSLVFTLPYNPSQEFKEYLQIMMTSVLILELIFLAIGILLGAAMKEYKRSGSVAVSLLLGTYVLSILVELSEDLAFLKWVTPFKYFNPVSLLNDSKFQPEYLALSAAIVVICLGAAYFAYQKRDLYI
ncbi:MAG: ABC transporter permease subunit [Anaerolineales bacterium]